MAHQSVCLGSYIPYSIACSAQVVVAFANPVDAVNALGLLHSEYMSNMLHACHAVSDWLHSFQDAPSGAILFVLVFTGCIAHLLSGIYPVARLDSPAVACYC